VKSLGRRRIAAIEQGLRVPDWRRCAWSESEIDRRMPTLFDPLTIGDLQVPNRIFMAPLTRNRSSGLGRAR
jgi:hypothetical protein